MVAALEEEKVKVNSAFSSWLSKRVDFFYGRALTANGLIVALVTTKTEVKYE